MVLAVTNLVGFGGGLLPTIEITDHGDATGNGVASGGTLTGSLTSTGEYSVLVFTWEDPSSGTIDALSVGGQAMSIQVKQPASGTHGVAIATYAGTLSGTVAVTWTGFGIGIQDCAATLVSLSGRHDYSIVDTDAGTTSLSSLTSPGEGGIRIVGAIDTTDTAQTFTGTDAELSDISGGGNYRHAVAYHIANSSAAIGDAAAEYMAGISIK